MHQYLKAIGFGNIRTRKELRKLLGDVENRFTHQTIVSYKPEKISVNIRNHMENTWELLSVVNWMKKKTLMPPIISLL